MLLLVEDEPLIRTVLAAALEDGGYSLVEACEGSEAIRSFEEHDRLIGIVTDIRLGDGPTGWEIARHARQKCPGLAVVYMSGDSAADWTSEGVPNSVMLQKPFATSQVVMAVAALLNATDVVPMQTNGIGG